MTPKLAALPALGDGIWTEITSGEPNYLLGLDLKSVGKTIQPRDSTVLGFSEASLKSKCWVLFQRHRNRDRGKSVAYDEISELSSCQNASGKISIKS